MDFEFSQIAGESETCVRCEGHQMGETGAGVHGSVEPQNTKLIGSLDEECSLAVCKTYKN